MPILSLLLRENLVLLVGILQIVSYSLSSLFRASLIICTRFLDLLEIASVPQSQLTATNSLGYSDSRIKDPESLHSTSVEGIDQDAHLGMTSIELNPTSPTGSSNFDSAAESGRRSSKPVAGMLTQFEVLSGREFRNLKRDWSLIVSLLLFTLRFFLSSNIS